jgi:uncharacterized protein YecE (DUF72 family)
MDRLFIGTCSWKYPSWEGLVYSSRETDSFLPEYSKRYNSVEIDQWFWSLGKGGASLPKREAVLEYDTATPNDFRFTVKCPNAITLTHHYAKKGEPATANPKFLDTGLFGAFIDAVAPLIPKIGLFIFQFEYLNKDKMPSKGAFLDRLAGFLGALPEGLPYAVEIRNPRWMDAAWFDMLREIGAAPVMLQGYWMDDVAGLIDMYGDRAGDTVCVRLHGEDREGMDEKAGSDWSRIIRPKDEELARIAYSIKTSFGRGTTVYISVNNHYEGCAPRTIGRLMPLLGTAKA